MNTNTNFAKDFAIVAGAVRFVTSPERWGDKYAAQAASILSSAPAVRRAARKIRAVPHDRHSLSVLGTILFCGEEWDFFLRMEGGE